METVAIKRAEDVDFDFSESSSNNSLEKEIRKQLHYNALRDILKAVNLFSVKILNNIDLVVYRVIYFYHCYQVERNIVDEAEGIKIDQEQKWCLLILVKASGTALKDIFNIEKVASKAITILNAAQISFSDMDLSDISIPAADLSYGIFDKAIFQRANLENV